MTRHLLSLAVLLPLAGCIGTVVHTATTVATAPVRVTAWTADKLTTSQAEADRNYGRRMRKEEAREGRERRDWARRCRGTPDAPECRTYTGFRAGN